LTTPKACKVRHVTAKRGPGQKKKKPKKKKQKNQGGVGMFKKHRSDRVRSIQPKCKKGTKARGKGKRTKAHQGGRSYVLGRLNSFDV